MAVTTPALSMTAGRPAREFTESRKHHVVNSGTEADDSDLLCLVVDRRGLHGGRFSGALAAACPRGTVINLPPDERCLDSDIRAALLAAHRAQWRIRLVVFLSSEMTSTERQFLASLSECIPEDTSLAVCLVSSLHVCFGNAGRKQAEATAAAFFERAKRVTVLRAGHAVRDGVLTDAVFRRSAMFYPLFRSAFRSCFVEEGELHNVIRSLLESDRSKLPNTVTLLGQNLALRDVLRNNRSGTWMQRTITAVSKTLGWLGGALLLWIAFVVARRVRQSLGVWTIHALRPESVEELLTHCNPWNRNHFAIAGYNTGVTHFGWKFPGRTVVQTTDSGKLMRLGNNRIRVDSGILLKQAVAKLQQANRDFHVLPNYSYISMGTVFMVPVHGSGSAVSTLGDTIESVLAYDMREDRLLTVRRGDPDFARAMYNPSGDLLVLRLIFRTRPRVYYVGREMTLTNPDAVTVWNTFDQPTASNVEIRKSSAADDDVRVRTWFTAEETSNGRANNDATEVPRDSLGRLWDRLEENPFSSTVFHALIRRFGFHVELFLTRNEFEVFWQAHRQLPLSKIQLRFFRRDGMPNSPGSDSDRISADLFMKRRDQHQFTEFMREHLPYARFNRGKHSL